PKVVGCELETQFIEVPLECIILTMKDNQKYLQRRDDRARLTPRVLAGSADSPPEGDAVIGGRAGRERPGQADAKLLFGQDRKKSVRAIARAIGQRLGGDVLAQQADTAARLAKTDLLTDMVGEFPELQGVMGGYYARHDGLSEDIAFAIEDHYKPRFAGDALPRNRVGTVVALADKLETLVGMFGIGNLPTGDKDPFALRRHALGVVRMLIEQDFPLGLADLIGAAVPAFGALIQDPRAALADFIYERLAGS